MQNTWHKLTQSVYNQLALAITGVALEIVQSASDRNGHAAWHALLCKYEQSGTATEVQLLNQISDSRLQESVDPDVLFGQIEYCRRRLISLGIPYCTKHLLAHVLRDGVLPAAYGGILSLLRYTRNLTYEEAKDIVRAHFTSYIRNGASSSNSVLTVEPPNRKMQHCSYCQM